MRPVVFVPVYFGYERIVEGDTYIGELSGQPKEKESVARAAAQSLRRLRERFGQVHVNFGEPIRLDAAARCATRRTGARAPASDGRGRAGSAPLVDELADAHHAQHQCRRRGHAGQPAGAGAAGDAAAGDAGGAICVRQLDLFLALLRALPYSERVTVTPLSRPRDRRLRRGAAADHRARRIALGDIRAHERRRRGARDLLPQQRAAPVRAAVAARLLLHRQRRAAHAATSSAWRGASIRTSPRSCSCAGARSELAGVVDGSAGGAGGARACSSRRRRATAGGGRRPASAQAMQLSLLAQATLQTIERYYLAIALLVRAGSGMHRRRRRWRSAAS